MLRRYGPAVLAHLALLAAWAWATTGGAVPRYIMPGPVETLQTLSVAR